MEKEKIPTSETGKMWVSTRILPMIAATLAIVTGLSTYSLSPAVSSQDCEYIPDGWPTQAQGDYRDRDYNFCFASDYESTQRLYRRRIQNDSDLTVRFDWPIAGLGNWIPPGEHTQATMSLGTAPPIDTGEIFFDFRQTVTSAYRIPPIGLIQKAWESLTSLLEGFIPVEGRLTRVTIEFTSQYADQHLIYSVRSQSEVPVKIYWLAFSEFWREKMGEEFSRLIQLMVEQGILAETSDNRMFTILPDRAAKWSFSYAGEPGMHFSRAELYDPDSRRPTMYGTVGLYLP